MRTPKFLFGFLLLLTATLATLATLAAAQTLTPGVDYELLSPPMATQAHAKGKKIEVVEFFSYMCPHCAHLDPELEKWLKNAPADVEFRRIPVVFRPQWEAPARLYFALKALNRLDLNSAVFTAIHTENVNLTAEANVIDWAASKGVERKQFTDVYKSFTVQTELSNAAQAMAAAKISSVPSLIVAGKYRTPGEGFKGDFGDLLRNLSAVVDKARKESGKK